MSTRLLSEVIDEIQTGNLLAFRVRRFNSFVSLVLKLYQKVTRAKYSHVGVVLRIHDRVFIVEAVTPKVVITPLDKVDDFYLIPAKPKASLRSQEDFLLGKVGVNYSLIDILTHFLGMDYSKDSIYCSELVSEFYNHVGYLTERESGHTPDKICIAVKTKVGISESIYVVTDRGNLK